MPGRYIRYPSLNATWQSPVATVGDLPLTGNTAGDARVTLDDNSIYIWGTDNAWHQVVGGGGGGSTNSFFLWQADTGSMTATSPTDVAIINGDSVNIRTVANSGTDTLTIELIPMVASKAVITSPGGQLTTSGASSTEVGYLLGVTSSIQTQLDSKQASGSYVTALTGDVTATGPGSVPATLATVMSSPNNYGNAANVGAFTVNGKGLITAATQTSISIAESQVINLVSDLAGKQATGNYLTALTGDVTAAGPGSSAGTLATVNANVGSFGSATAVATQTVNAKGLTTAAASVPIQIAESQVTNLVTDLASKSVRTSFYFKPGGVANAAKGIYTTWATLYADLNLYSGPRTVIVDDLLTDAHVTAGSYDLATVTFEGASNGTSPALIFDTGVTINGVYSISNNLSFRTSALSPIWTITGTSAQLTVDTIASIISDSGSEFIKIDNGSLFLILKSGAGISTNTYEVINAINNSGVTIYIENVAQVAQDSIRGDVSSTLFEVIASDSASATGLQSNFAGSITVSTFCNSGLVDYDTNDSGGTGITVKTALDALNFGQASTQLITPTTGGSGTISDGIYMALLTPAGAIATYTLTMPLNPLDNQRVRIASSGFGVAALTLAPNTGKTFSTGAAVTALAVNTFVEYLFIPSTSKWYRVG